MHLEIFCLVCCTSVDHPSPVTFGDVDQNIDLADFESFDNLVPSLAFQRILLYNLVAVYLLVVAGHCMVHLADMVDYQID